MEVMWHMEYSNMIELHNKVISTTRVTGPGNRAKSRWLRHVFHWRQNALITVPLT